MPEYEAKEKCDEIAQALGQTENIYQISAINKLNTDPLCFDIMELLETMPVDKFEETKEEVEFKWDTYHEGAVIDESGSFEDDEDWDEDDYDVEVIYQR